jgi:tetratricopeptide (TPR) repeat protein
MKTRVKVFRAVILMTVVFFFLLCRNSMSANCLIATIGMDATFISENAKTDNIEFAIFSERLNEHQIIPIQEDDSLKARLMRANNLARQGKTGEASKIFTGIMENYPDNKAAVQGWLMVNMKRSPTGEEEAIQMLLDLGKLYPKNTGIIFFKMFLEAEHGRNEEALKDVEILIGLQPDTAVNWVAKGQILYEIKQYNQALEAFSKATNLDPRRADVWGMKAGALAKLGRFDEALISVNKGIELAPNFFAGIYNRACIFCLKGDKVNALADLKKAIELNPGIKNHAKMDEDFRSMFEDEDFKNLTK